MDNCPNVIFRVNAIHSTESVAHLQTKDRSFTGDPSSARPQELQEKERYVDEQQDNESFSLSISLFRSSFDN